jgi:hypothetical protein
MVLSLEQLTSLIAANGWQDVVLSAGDVFFASRFFRRSAARAGRLF